MNFEWLNIDKAINLCEWSSKTSNINHTTISNNPTSFFKALIFKKRVLIIDFKDQFSYSFWGADIQDANPIDRTREAMHSKLGR